MMAPHSPAPHAVSTTQKQRNAAKLNGNHYETECVNDPSAGSPTETVLRLLHPLEGSIYATSRPTTQARMISPMNSQDPPIGCSDGRCVQGAGTQSAQAADLRLLGIPR